MWISQPDKLGYWLFVGMRTSRSNRAVVQIAAPVLIKDEKGYPEWTIYYSGSGMAYTIPQHEGKWFYLEDLLSESQSRIER